MSTSAALPVSFAEQFSSYRWVILAVLWITYVVVFLARLSVGPLAPFLKEDLHITSAQVGLVMSTAAFGYMLTQIPVGWLVDRIGARWPIAVGEILAGFCMFGVAVSPSYAWMLGLMLLVGMSCGCLMPATTQAVVVWFPRRERATVMGIKQMAVNAGGIIGAATLPAIALAWGWRAGFGSLGIVAIAIGAISLVFYRNPTAAPATEATGAAPRVALRSLAANREIWLVAVAGLCMNWVEMAMIGHFVLYMKEALAFSVVAAGAMLATAETAGAFARPGSGLVSDWLFRGRRKPVFLILAVMTTAMCVVLAAAGPSLGRLMFPVVFVFGIGGVGFGAICFTMLSEFGGRQGAGTASAFGSTVGMIGSIVGPIAFGHIVDISRSYEMAWWSQAAIGSLAVVALLFVRESLREI